MTEPRIQYAKTRDGVSIAYWTLGEGAPLVVMPWIPFNHIQLNWRDNQPFYARLAEKRRVIHYDCRGSGLSDHRAADYSLDAHALDLQAVVERLGLEQFDVWAFLISGPVAIAYAAQHPERVSRLVLWCSFARAADLMQSPQLQGLLGLIDKDYELFTETLANVVFGWSAGEPARRFAAYMRESASLEVVQASVSSLIDLDVTGILPQVRTPTLVLQRRQMLYPDVGAARQLAAGMPDARLVVVEGTSSQIAAEDDEAVLKPVFEFLGLEWGEAVTAAPTRQGESGGLVTVLFTDIEGSTALTQRLGDAKAREVLREHERIVRQALKAHGGAEVKTMGDGFMASFASATRALECAIEMQRAFAVHNELKETPIRVRIGLNAGEPIAEESDLFGTAVIMAERICGHAAGGEILASNVVRELVAGKGFLFAGRGEQVLRGFEDPVRLHEVRW